MSAYRSTLRQLATYIERDGASIRYRGGDAIVSVPVLGGEDVYTVPEHLTEQLREERSRVRKAIAARRKDQPE